MSANQAALVRICQHCSIELAPGALACQQCHALVHAEELQRLAATAKDLEAKGELRQAQETWLEGLPLLPRASKQADWIRDHARNLERAADAAEAAAGTQNSHWARKLAPLGPLALVLAKGKAVLAALLNLKFLFSLAAFLGVYWALYGAKFGIGFAALILVHEMGHFIDIKRRGLPAEMPVFLPGLGAYVRWQALGVSLETRAAVSLAGPLAGWVGAVACALLWWKTGNGIWAALAHVSAWLNVLNLIPVWVLDGGQAASALSKTERAVLLVSSLGLGLGLGQKVFFIVAMGAAWRLFTKDLPPRPSHAITAYFLAVLTLLGLLMWVLPAPRTGMF